MAQQSKVKKIKEASKSKITNEKNRLKGLKKVEKKCLLKELNKEYEIARLRKLDKTTREESIKKIYNKCKDNFVSLCTKRSSSKIIQCLIKYGDEKMIESIFNEIKESVKEIICRPFGSFVFEKLYKFDYCKKLIKENAKFLICDRIGVEFLNTIYKHDRKVIEGVWLTEKLLTSENIGMISIKEVCEKLVKKEMFKYEIAHDIIFLGAVRCKNNTERKLEQIEANNYQTDAKSLFKGNTNLLKIIKGQQMIDIEVYKKSIKYSEEEMAIFAACMSFLPDLLTTRNGTILALNTIKAYSCKHIDAFEQILPYFLKIASNEFGMLFLLHFYETLDKERIHEQVDLLFYDLFINEHSVRIITEVFKNTDYVVSEDKINFILENYTDNIRNHNWPLIIECTKRNESVKCKNTNMIQNYKQNNILNDPVALKYFLQLETLGLLDLKHFLGVEYEKLINKYN